MYALVVSMMAAQQRSGAVPPPQAGGSFRYWRINGIDVPTTNLLEISEIQLISFGVNVTSSATKTASTNPDVLGALADLYDGSLTTRCAYANATIEDVNFYFLFDFGTPTQITGVKQGGYDNSSRYMQAFTLQYASDASPTVWTTLGSKSGLAYPGNNTLSSEYSIP